MIKGIDVYVDSGVHIQGFTKLTKKAREIAKQKLIDEIQNDKCILVWDIYEENEEVSSNGKTSVSNSENVGSIPTTSAKSLGE